MGPIILSTSVIAPFLGQVANRRPIFTRSCRLAQSGTPATPREVHLPLLPHGPSGVHRHLPRRTQLRQSTGPEENRSVPLTLVSGTKLFYSCWLFLSRQIFANQQAIFLLCRDWNFAVIGHNRARKRARTVAGVSAAISGNLMSDTAQNALGVGHVSTEIPDHHLDGHRLLGLVPTVVI